MYEYHSPDNTHPHLHTTLSVKWGGGVYSNIRLFLTPPQTCRWVKSHDDLAIAIWKNSSNIG